MSSDRRYSQEEVDAILKRALERERAPADAVTHQDLLDTAREVGIEPAQVEAAIVEVKREEQRLAVKGEWLRRRKERFNRSAISWASVSALCLVINLVTGGAMWWPWVFGPWGLAVFLQYLRAQRGPSERDLVWMERRLRGEQRKQELQARFERGAAVLETVVEQGASLLLAHLDEKARKRDALGAPPPRDPLPPKR